MTSGGAAAAIAGVNDALIASVARREACNTQHTVGAEIGPMSEPLPAIRADTVKSRGQVMPEWSRRCRPPDLKTQWPRECLLFDYSAEHPNAILRHLPIRLIGA